MDTLYLVLPAGTLTAGGYYQFQLSAQYAQGTGAASATPGYSVLAVQMNAPPSSGTIAVTVSGGEPIGVVLQDPYDLACSGWVDDVSDLPLLYSFYYAIFGSATEYQLVSNTPSDSYDGALLPRGGGNASEVICIAYVADSYAAASRTTAVATVLPMSRLGERPRQPDRQAARRLVRSRQRRGERPGGARSCMRTWTAWTGSTDEDSSASSGHPPP